jgi:hypothetical protein
LNLAGLRLLDYQFGWLQGSRNLLKGKKILVAGVRNLPIAPTIRFEIPILEIAA